LSENIEHSKAELVEEAIDPLNANGHLDHLTYHLARYKFASRLLQSTDNVLDYGCGTGYGTRLMRDYARYVYGVDNNEACIEKAHQRYGESFGVWDLLNLIQEPLDAAFDVITCFEVIEHMASDAANDLLFQLSNCLTKHGFLILSTPRAKPMELRSVYRKRFHTHEYKWDELHALLCRHFARVLPFTQTDEIISAGNRDVCWTYIALCYG